MLTCVSLILKTKLNKKQKWSKQNQRQNKDNNHTELLVHAEYKTQRWEMTWRFRVQRGAGKRTVTCPTCSMWSEPKWNVTVEGLVSLWMMGDGRGTLIIWMLGSWAITRFKCRSNSYRYMFVMFPLSFQTVHANILAWRLHSFKIMCS